MSRLEKEVKLNFKLPVFYNDKTPISDNDIVDVKNYFVSLYGGLTVDSPSEGFWNDDGLVYYDMTMEYSVFIKQKEFEKKFKNNIPQQITKFKRKFKQLEILCYYYSVVST